MSRAIFQIALAHTLGRDPTDKELEDLLSQLRSMSEGERLYIPQREPDHAAEVKIHSLRDAGMSIRAIAKTTGYSKSQVHRVLSQNPPYFWDSNAA